MVGKPAGMLVFPWRSIITLKEKAEVPSGNPAYKSFCLTIIV